MMLTAHRTSGEADFAIARELIRSPPETVKDDSPSALPGLEADTRRLGEPHAAHYLFNSMPCAYTWFYH
jgi:hypothetical protein